MTVSRTTRVAFAALPHRVLTRLVPAAIFLFSTAWGVSAGSEPRVIFERARVLAGTGTSVRVARQFEATRVVPLVECGEDLPIAECMGKLVAVFEAFISALGDRYEDRHGLFIVCTNEQASYGITPFNFHNTITNGSEVCDSIHHLAQERLE